MTIKVLFIEPVEFNNSKRKKVCLQLWQEGKAFMSIKGDEILSIKSVDKYREKYDKICIQYDTGVVDV